MITKIPLGDLVRVVNRRESLPRKRRNHLSAWNDIWDFLTEKENILVALIDFGGIIVGVLLNRLNNLSGVLRSVERQTRQSASGALVISTMLVLI